MRMEARVDRIRVRLVPSSSCEEMESIEEDEEDEDELELDLDETDEDRRWLKGPRRSLRRCQLPCWRSSKD